MVGASTPMLEASLAVEVRQVWALVAAQGGTVRCTVSTPRGILASCSVSRELQIRGLTAPGGDSSRAPNGFHALPAQRLVLGGSWCHLA